MMQAAAGRLGGTGGRWRGTGLETQEVSTLLARANKRAKRSLAAVDDNKEWTKRESGNRGGQRARGGR